jgi:hypothetical protein
MRAKQSILQQSEERFRALTEKSADIVFITNSTGVVSYESVDTEGPCGWWRSCQRP